MKSSNTCDQIQKKIVRQSVGLGNILRDNRWEFPRINGQNHLDSGILMKLKFDM